MSHIELKIAELRKQKGISQQYLADILGISFQSVSKWETNVTMPDITLLPRLADYFEVSVDELLGLKPLKNEQYIKSKAGTKPYWDERLSYLENTRKSIWNSDYIQFLIEKVWRITTPTDILDCGCGCGFLGAALLPLLPNGSTYTGIDFSEVLINEAVNYFEGTKFSTNFICDDVLNYTAKHQYDFVISHTVLRHIDVPYDFLNQMISFCKSNGLVICIDVNREIESDGLFIKGLEYEMLCDRKGFRKIWGKEFEQQGRDYAISMKTPEIMQQLGLKNVDIRMNDKVNFVSPQTDGYPQIVSDFTISHGWHKIINNENREEIINLFMNHGMDRKEAEFYCAKQNKISDFIGLNKDTLTYTHLLGLMISYGTK